MDIKPYNYVIVPDGDGFFGYVMECNGCMTQGDTIEEVWNNLQDALECWTRSVEKHGQEMPVPVEPRWELAPDVIRLAEWFQVNLTHDHFMLWTDVEFAELLRSDWLQSLVNKE